MHGFRVMSSKSFIEFTLFDNCEPILLTDRPDLSLVMVQRFSSFVASDWLRGLQQFPAVLMGHCFTGCLGSFQIRPLEAFQLDLKHTIPKVGFGQHGS